MANVKDVDFVESDLTLVEVVDGIRFELFQKDGFGLIRILDNDCFVDGNIEHLPQSLTRYKLYSKAVCALNEFVMECKSNI